MTSDPLPSAEVAAFSVWRRMRFVLPLQIVFVLIAIGFGAYGVWGRAELALILAPVLWLPAALEFMTRALMPRLLHGAYAAFIAAGPFAGSAANLYSALPGWDKVVHFYSGILVGWAILFALGRLGILDRERFPIVAFIVQCAVMASAAGWEICEFVSDHLLGTHAQHDNLDTMGDIISATLGGVVMLLLARFAHVPKAIVGVPPLPRRAVRDEDPSASVLAEPESDVDTA